ncbi:MAG: DUF5074 domain-containing protein [Muribaculaceae bacterium]|nr:DUF5074 domain-containing protein [Muribaculaceae bacterium]
MRTKLLSLAIGLSVMTAMAHPIDFDKIRNWTGTGPNRAALVIQYNGDTYGSDSYVWGYRWENGETPTGETMMKAICANSSRLSMLTQYTGSMGSTLCGVGYSLNQDVLNHVFFNFEKAKDFEFINFDYYNVNSFMGQTEAPGDNAPALAQQAIEQAIAGSHYIQHPFDYGKYGYPAYDYDCWDIDTDTENRGGITPYEPKWLSAWYEGYWSYWCANSPSQDWMYSGSGFTGRTLVDGAVDGWSFTQFESAMVGGMGEGVAPCEDGDIIYMPGRLLTQKIDASKCTRTVGTGNARLPLIVRFGNPDKIDNVVLSLCFNSEIPTASEVLSILESDRAFSLEGNTLSIDADGDGIFNNSGDDTCTSGDWHLTEFEDCLMLSCADNQIPDYLLYLPAVHETCAVIPDKLTYSLSDNKNYIPVFVQRDEVYDAINYSWYRRTDNLQETSSTSNDIVSSIGTGASNFGQLTYKGNKAGELYIHVRVRTGKGASYSYSNVCHFTLLPPEIPIERIEFSESSIDAPLNTTIENLITIYPDNATYTALTYSTSDSKIATANATAIKTTKTPGSATITVSSTWNPEVNASFDIVSTLRHPVTDFAIKGVEGDVIFLNPKQMIGVIADPIPADADIPDFNVTLEGAGSSKDEMIASMYKVNYWDENNTRIQFYELSGHRAGECTLKLTSTDGSNITKTYTVKVEEQDRTPLENGYIDGTFVLNEEWFGHTNGGMNYITPEGEMMYQVYERENPGMSFGCTSQYATIWADKLIAVSKQAVDAGDPLPGGGRVVIADAKTLKRQGSIDDLMFGDETKSADGRAVVGATPDKVYVGTSNGIYIVNIDEIKVIGKITAFDESGSAGADLYSGQIGDMVHAGKYVFGIKQATGAFAINTETDQVVKNYPFTTVQGITQTADGNIWIASTESGRGVFTCINPETLEINDDLSITLPDGMAYPTCSWGAWRNTPFVGSHTTNCIWFSAGGGIAGGSAKDKYYQWEVGTPASEIKLVFDMEAANLTGSNSRVKQKTYGTLRYDDRSGELIVMTTEDSASGHYRYNWTHFVNPETAEIVRTIALRPYYWFQSFAIFPDKYDVVIDLEEIAVNTTDGEKVLDLSEIISDRDNIDNNIKISLLDTPIMLDDNNDEPSAEVSLTGKQLKVIPHSIGSHFFTLAAESNGRMISKTVEVKVSDVSTGINDVTSESKSITCDGQRIYISGFNGKSFTVYDVAGRMVNSFRVDAERYVFDFGGHQGIYILKSDSNFSSKVIIK